MFYDLPADDYIVIETYLLGYTAVSDIDGGDERLVAVTIGGTMLLKSTGNDFVDEQLVVLGATLPVLSWRMATTTTMVMFD